MFVICCANRRDRCLYSIVQIFRMMLEGSCLVNMLVTVNEY